MNIANSLIKQIKKDGIYYTFTRAYVSPQYRNDFYKDLVDSVKFYIGSSLEIPNVNLLKEEAPLFPFDNCYFEMCDDTQRSNVAFLCDKYYIDKSTKSYDAEITIFLRPVNGRWDRVPCFIDLQIDYGQITSIKYTWLDPSKEIRNSNIMGKDHKKYLSLKSYITMLLYSLFRFLKVMNCSNIQIVDHTFKKNINSKREKKGKLPFFEYKTAHINSKRTKAKSKKHAGTHPSPRVHLRRGHIRKLASGKTTWVQDCVVGNKEKGVVYKDYVVHHD